MAYDVPLDSRARHRGYFDPASVRRLLNEHMTGTSHHSARLWNPLMLEWRHRTWIDQFAPSVPQSRLPGDVAEIGARPSSVSA